MNPERAEKLRAIRAIFDEAAELPVAARAEFVRTACAGDMALATEVTSLLDALERQSEPLETDAGTQLMDPTPADAQTLAWPPGSTGAAEAPGARAPSQSVSDASNLGGVVVGDFRLIRIIGRGAMGAVYEAEQLSLGRRVAVKLLQSWTTSADARRRFIEEASILARLNHPGIAQVITAGTRQLDLAGPDRSLAMGLFNDLHSVPWFAMELVDGARTIVDHCRRVPLSPMVVLQLFASVCDAVHHGHQQGVIHRDLKPANILVSAGGEPRVIDFGIAKALSVGAGEAAEETLRGSLMGTLCYMSPEQCDGTGRPVDTRSDVYALGVVLYESLTGQLPYTVDTSSFATAAQNICNSTPKDPRVVSPAIPVDAAIVVLKAMRKEPNERYQSAADFAADLRRVIALEPVLARPASIWYKLAKLARRRPTATAFAAVALLGLIAGIVGISLGLARERAARTEAERSTWLANLVATDAYLRLNDSPAAKRRLMATPAAYRGWEWGYLKARADTRTDVWQAANGFAETHISPSSRFACTLFADGGRVIIFDLATRTPLQTLTLPDQMPLGSTPVWSPDERMVALAGGSQVALIEMATGSVTKTLKAKDAWALSAAWSPDGTLMAIGCVDRVLVCRVSTGEVVFERPAGEWVYLAAFSPDGGTLAWSDSGRVLLVNPTTGQEQGDVPLRQSSDIGTGSVRFSPDGRSLAVRCGLEAAIIDVATRSVRKVLRGHTQKILSMTFDAAGGRLATTAIDRSIRVWDADTGVLLSTLLGHDAVPVGACFVASRPDVLISSDKANNVCWWNLTEDGPVRTVRLDGKGSTVGDLYFSPDSSTLRVSSGDTVASVALGNHPASPVKVLGQDLGVSMMIPQTATIIRMLDLTNLVAQSIETTEQLWSVTLDANYVRIVSNSAGTTLAVALKSGEILLLNTKSGKELGRMNTGGQYLRNHIFSPDGTMLATLDRPGRISIWDVRTSALRTEVAKPSDRAMMLAWGPDGSTLMFSQASTDVSIWSVASQSVVQRIEGIGGQVWCAAIRPDLTRLAVGAQDRITHIYQLPSGDELVQLRDHTGTVINVTWSPDGRYLATGGYDKKVFVYDSAAEAPAAQGRSRAP